MFTKYTSLTNITPDLIEELDKKYPEPMEFLVTEKLHGAQVSLHCYYKDNKTVQYEVCSRNRVLQEDDKFFGIQEFLKEVMTKSIEWQQLLTNISDIVLKTKQPLMIYGEFFGPGINKGVDYGDTKDLRFFDIRLGYDNPVLNDLEIYLKVVPEALWVPYELKVAKIKDILNDYRELVTVVNPKPGNTAEGVVLRPHKGHISLDTVNGGRPLVLKHKNQAFLERSSKRKTRHRQPKKPTDPKIIELRAEFDEYINYNRVRSFISKEGPFVSMRDLGTYIKGIIEDAKTDFVEQTDLPPLSKRELKAIMQPSAKKVRNLLLKGVE